MFQTILQALVPVIFVAGLGWLVGRLRVLDPERIRSITTFIVTVALPAAVVLAAACPCATASHAGVHVTHR